MLHKVQGRRFDNPQQNKQLNRPAQYISNESLQFSKVIKNIQSNWFFSLSDDNDQCNFPPWFDFDDYQRRMSVSKEIVQISDLQNAIAENISLIIYLQGPERYSGILIDQTRLQHFDIGEIDDINQKIAAVIQELRTSSTTSPFSRHKLNQKLLPLEIVNFLKPDLFVASIGTLCQIPFSAFIETNLGAKPKENKQSITLEQDHIIKVNSFECFCAHGCTSKSIRSDNVSINRPSTFLQNGAKYSLETLWDVPKEHNETFLNAFYHALSTSKRAELALQLATQKMREKYGKDKPFYWAGYFLVRE